MRIGVLSQWYDPEPGPAAVPGLVARGLRRAGHEVVVLTGYPNYPTGELAAGYRQHPHLVEDRAGVQVHRVPLYPSHGRSAPGRAANYTSFAASAGAAAVPVLGRADVVWIYNSPATVVVPTAMTRLVAQVPNVLHIQDVWPDSVVGSGLLPTGRTGRVAQVCLGSAAALSYRLAAEIAVTSPGMLDLLAARGVPSAKLHWVPNCADEQVFAPLPYNPVAAAELGCTGRFTLMYAGSLGDVQSLDTAVRAAELLRDLPTFRLLLVGSGTAEPALRRLVRELRLANVDFLPRRPAAELPALMRACEAQLVSLQDRPFLSATMPSKVQSVLAAGRPVAVSARGDAADLVRAAGAGLTCPPEDPGALAAVVRQLVAMSPGEREAMGRSGRTYYLEHLGAGRLTQQLEELCARAVDRSRRRASHRPVTSSAQS